VQGLEYLVCDAARGARLGLRARQRLARPVRRLGEEELHLSVPREPRHGLDQPKAHLVDLARLVPALRQLEDEDAVAGVSLFLDPFDVELAAPVLPLARARRLDGEALRRGRLDLRQG
jgi:hypothetical protein